MNTKLKILGIIPSRYASTRFPGKPLVDIGGKTMIERVYRQALKSDFLTKVVVATDDKRIYTHTQEFGADVVMTDPSHVSGTDRCHEVVQLLHEKYDFIINIQGDEPFIQPQQIDTLAQNLTSQTSIATLCKKIEDIDVLFNENIPKVIFNESKNAIYFSRHPIPFFRGKPLVDWLQYSQYYKHIGIYAYRVDILEQITKLKPSKLELAESLEQLRWVENGYNITLIQTILETIGIDVPEDLLKIKNLL